MTTRTAKIAGALVLVVGLGGCIIEADPHDAPLYASCYDTADCDRNADACFVVTNMGASGGMCSTFCATEADCLGWAGCYALAGDPSDTRICYSRCTSDHDCAFGFACLTAIDPAGNPIDRICLPR